ncbi:MAG: hypothetical protein U1E89_14960 [Burkholderiaceae bacterium]
MPSLGQSLVIVRKASSSSFASKSASVPSLADQANVVVAKAGKALSRPGIDKQKVVFRAGQNGKVFAYSIHPTDPSMVLREGADGTRKMGRLVNGKFKAA